MLVFLPRSPDFKRSGWAGSGYGDSVVAKNRPDRSLDALRVEAASCRACDLWKDATQTVFGTGLASADVMLVGEKPGDKDDREGAPFVGPAGRILYRALHESGLNRRSLYVTNAVKHFKSKPKGKRRIHQRPNFEEIRACHPWLQREIAVVRPRVIVCLGAVAVQSLVGRSVAVTRDRGIFFEAAGSPPMVPTVHPSSILRARDDESRRKGLSDFVRDLLTVEHWLAQQDRRRVKKGA